MGGLEIGQVLTLGVFVGIDLSMLSAAVGREGYGLWV